jgi:hypothetical protein
VADPIVDYLLARGQLPEPRVTPLTGGVSGETVLVESVSSRLVVKRALGRLLVAAEWTAKPQRAMTEARALELLHGLTPAHTPELRHADPDRNTIVMTAAPAGWQSWKDVLARCGAGSDRDHPRYCDRARRGARHLARPNVA